MHDHPAMGLFSKEEPKPKLIRDELLRCVICRGMKFHHRESMLNTSVAVFFNFGRANTCAECYVCSECGYMHWFLRKP